MILSQITWDGHYLYDCLKQQNLTENCLPFNYHKIVCVKYKLICFNQLIKTEINKYEFSQQIFNDKHQCTYRGPPLSVLVLKSKKLVLPEPVRCRAHSPSMVVWVFPKVHIVSTPLAIIKILYL